MVSRERTERAVALRRHGWGKDGRWFVGLTDGANDQTKGRDAFVFGDFRRIHRSGIIACHYRAAEWRHKAIELAAHELLQLLDEATAREVVSRDKPSDILDRGRMMRGGVLGFRPFAVVWSGSPWVRL
jgi:hypothetical protein